MADSTTPSQGSAGYGFLWWLQGDGTYRASGIYGQGIYISPEENLVIAVLSAWTTATGSEYSAHRNGLFEAIGDTLR
jgi:CubicO group peptidase (beta-lactamase class C family)